MFENTVKSCSFFGHRDIKITEELKRKVKEIVEDLITKHEVLTFLFGSRSNFNTLCLLVVSDLKNKYPAIKRIAYTCRSESCVLERDRDKWEKIYAHLQIHLLSVEEEYEHKTKYISGRASYIERNYAMIDKSDYCIFCYDENYRPDLRKYSKRSVGYYQPKSGTSLAFVYAKQKKKHIINVI